MIYAVTATSENAQENVTEKSCWIAGLSAAVSFIVAIIIGFLLGLLTMFLVTPRKVPAAGPANVRSVDPVYEQVTSSSVQNFELNKNEAYGPIANRYIL